MNIREFIPGQSCFFHKNISQLIKKKADTDIKAILFSDFLKMNLIFILQSLNCPDLKFILKDKGLCFITYFQSMNPLLCSLNLNFATCMEKYNKI